MSHFTCLVIGEDIEAERRLRDQRNAELARPSATVTALQGILAQIDGLAGEVARVTKERNALLAALDAVMTCNRQLGAISKPVADEARAALALCGKGAQ